MPRHLTKTTCLCCVAWLLTGLGGHRGHAATIPVFLLGGQSNMRGSGRSADLPTEPFDLRSPQDAVAYFSAELPGGLTTLRPSTSFGPEITFGHQWAAALADGPLPKLALIKYARGGTSIRDHWTPGGDATTAGDGAEYQVFQTTVGAGLAALQAAYPDATFEIVGMLWQQGERDVVLRGTASREYEANFRNLIHDIRATYGKDLPFVFGRLSLHQTNLTDPGRGAPEDFMFVRQAQERINETVPATRMVDTDPFSLLPDRLHFGTLGQQQLGTAMASAMQELIAVPEPRAEVLLLWILPALFAARRLVVKSTGCHETAIGNA